MKKYYYFIILLVITVIRCVSPAFSFSNITIVPFSCPNKLLEGERGEVEYTIDNFGSQININEIVTLVDRRIPENGASQFISSANLTYPLPLRSGSELTLKGQFISTEEGVHYIDAMVNYSAKINNVTTPLSEYKELCKVEVVPIISNQASLAPAPGIIQIILSALLFPAIAGVVVYWLKSSFVKKELAFQETLKSELGKKDSEFQQRNEHKIWLLQHLHLMASKYYIPLSKHANESRLWIEIASASGDITSIKTAYYYVYMFLAKYKEFETIYGAKYLLEDYQKEDQIIRKSQAIIAGLPFELQHINEIAKSINTSEKNSDIGLRYECSEAFICFSNWIKSRSCKKTKELVRGVLVDLWNILELEGDKVSQPNFNLDSFREKMKRDRDRSSNFAKQQEDISNKKKNTPFWFLYSSKKCVRKEDCLVIFGKGFVYEYDKYKFKLKKTDLENQDLEILEIIDDNNVKIKIPKDIKSDTYDIYAEHKENGKWKPTQEAIVVHIESCKVI